MSEAFVKFSGRLSVYRMGHSEILPFLGGYERVGGCWGRPISDERVGGYPCFGQEKENIDILGNCGHFVAQKVSKYSKIAQSSLLRSF
jgi:hypothetical protein